MPLRLEGVAAGYGRKQILRQLSLEVNEGEVVALIGPNGAGKTTVLRVAAGLITPWEGSVWLDGEDVTKRPPRERVQRGLVYLLQGGKVFEDLKVRENLEIGLLLLSKAQRQSALDRVLEWFPVLRENLNRRAGVLSGGQRQMVAFAMALAMQPRVLMLDEPSAGLSPELAAAVLDAVRIASRRARASVLLVEQRLTDALRISSRAIVLVGGEIRETMDADAFCEKK